MEKSKFDDYEFAAISTEKETKLKDLEKAITEESGKNIVLIAYEQKSDSTFV